MSIRSFIGKILNAELRLPLEPHHVLIRGYGPVKISHGSVLIRHDGYHSLFIYGSKSAIAVYGKEEKNILSMSNWQKEPDADDLLIYKID